MIGGSLSPMHRVGNRGWAWANAETLVHIPVPAL